MIDPKDLIIQRWSSKPKTQWVHHNLNGVMIRHIPTGLIVRCDKHRGQYRNKDEAMGELEQLIINEKPLVEKYREALENISQLGSVCDNFELCEHESCRDSSGAVLIALEALRDA